MEQIKEEYKRRKLKNSRPTTIRLAEEHINWVNTNEINLSAYVRDKIENMEGFNENIQASDSSDG